MKCPRCSAPITVAPDPSGTIVCGGCGARLRSKSASAAATPAPMSDALSPVPTPLPGGPKNDTPTLRRQAMAAGAAPAPSPSSGGGIGFEDGAPVAKKPNASGSVPRPSGAVSLSGPSPAAAGAFVTLENLMEELRALRASQDRILDILTQGGAPSFGRSGGDGGGSGMADMMGGDEMPVAASRRSAAPAPPVRPRKRKTVLIVDDDDQTRAEAMAALTTAEVPTRDVNDGNLGLAAIAEQKPDVIVLELDVSGAMAGRDVVNMIKATMEWVDIPIVLYTRVPIENQKEARTIHGADDFVLKGPGSAEQLVSRVIQIFRRG